jgi:hypothetical protein
MRKITSGSSRMLVVVFGLFVMSMVMLLILYIKLGMMLLSGSGV